MRNLLEEVLQGLHRPRHHRLGVRLLLASAGRSLPPVASARERVVDGHDHSPRVAGEPRARGEIADLVGRARIPPATMDEEHPRGVARGAAGGVEDVRAAAGRHEGRAGSFLVGAHLALRAAVLPRAVPDGAVPPQPLPHRALDRLTSTAASVLQLAIHAAVCPVGTISAQAALDAPNPAGRGRLVRHDVGEVLLEPPLLPQLGVHGLRGLRAACSLHPTRTLQAPRLQLHKV
mmetsp:Transcript_3742/g.9943  ORF Transcript_3742/g.9943 Transcript_3742/m.9943 type:complete len:233 (+) Transcript_3742:364-1062(+)